MIVNKNILGIILGLIILIVGILWSIFTLFELYIDCKELDPIYCNPLWIIGRIFFPIILDIGGLWLINRFNIEHNN